MSRRYQVIALGLDAMEGSVVDRMISAGGLPNIARLRAQGVSAPLKTLPDGFLSMVWPTFFAGQDVGAHGWYFNKLWSPRDQRLRYADNSWLPKRAFWDDLGPGIRSAILDVPFSTIPEPGFNGIYLNGWQAHDDFGKLALPASLHRDLQRNFGRPAMGPEIFGPQDARTLERQLRESVGSLEQLAEIAADILDRESPDLTLAVLGGTHRAMHYLWSLDEADVSGLAPDRLDRLHRACAEVYEAADRAVGKILRSAPSDARVAVFALHGMGRNRGWAEHFGKILAHIHARGRDVEQKEGAIYRLKRALPWRLVRQVTMRLPSSVNHALIPIWSRNMLDWSQTRFFALPLDLNGYIRINVKGREAKGVVEPGAELENLIDELTEDLLALTDLRDGSPIVAGVDRVDDAVGPSAPRRDVLPDLVARWTDSYSSGSPGVRTRYGEVRWDPEAPLPSGRSGNHVQGGWLVASGPGISNRTLTEPLNTLDVAPTLMEWLGVEVPAYMEGSPIGTLTRTAEAGA
jgi:predicted AlkP superfamily phosphohydrolase/phosphomutase